MQKGYKHPRGLVKLGWRERDGKRSLMSLKKLQQWCAISVVVMFFWCIAPIGLWAESPGFAPAISLDAGFRLLYDLDFGQAHQVFSAWEQAHPEDPLGPVSDAAGLLFSEFDRLGVLESQFYASDASFAARQKLTPDPGVRDRFEAALDLAENRAHARLSKNPKDHDGLFALTLAAGLRGDYAALIEKRNLVALHYKKESSMWAAQLLAVDPKCYDAHLSTGFTKYIVGSMSLPMRWILRLGGVQGDKDAGIAELKITAQHGRYLAPMARIMLAIADVRDKNYSGAREILSALHQEFPKNPLFPREMARLDKEQ